jgi:hypothetical protein
MRDTDTPLCECSGFQRTSKGRGGGREFREQSPRILKFSPTLKYSIFSLSKLYQHSQLENSSACQLILGVILTRK